MNTKKKTIKSILGCSTAFSAVLLSGLGVMNLHNPKYEVLATYIDRLPVSISNSNFNSNTSSTYPFKPNNFTATSSSTGADSNVTAGVVKLTDEKYETRFSLAKRTSLDDYVLMIDSTKEDDNGNVTKHSVEYGYTTNSAITLDSNSKYMISVDVFTATDDAIASLRLYDTKNQENGKDTLYSSIDDINSYNNWTSYSFFVSTNNYEGLSLKLGMYLNGAGTVLFDNISCFKLSDNEYEYNKTLTQAGTYTEKSEIDNIISTFNINDSNALTDGTNSYSFTGVKYEFGKNSFAYVKDEDGQNSNAVLITNEKETFTQYETESILTFEPNRLYKVSVNVKTKNLSGFASLQLVRTDIDEDDANYDAENHNKTIKISSNTYSKENSLTNDYKMYSFVINSHSSKTVTYKLKFGLGSSDDLTIGEMYLSEIEVSKINYEIFNNTSSGSETEKIDFVKAYKNNDNMLDNADFNAFKIADYSAPIPAEPIDWEVSTGENTQYYGVVNTLTFDTDLERLNLSPLTNPSKNENNNVLMMYNATADTLSYTSNTKSLEANSYHKFELDIQTQNAPLTLSLVTVKDEKEIVLLSKTFVTEQPVWNTVALYIHTGYQKMDVALKLTLETSSYGYAYVDNAKFDWTTNPTMPATTEQIQEEFKTASNSSNVGVVDLTNIITSASTSNFETAPYFTYEETQGVQTGTITLKSAHLDEVITSPAVPAGELTNLEIFNKPAEDDVDKKVMSIWTTDYVSFSTTSTIGFTLEKGSDSASAKYYKISVDVFTQNLEAQEDNDFGAGIKLTGYDNSFTNIVSNNAWTTYTFYVKPDSTTTTYLELSLGNETNKTKGAVFFGNLTFDDTIEASEYNAIKDSTFVKVLTKTTSDDDNKTETETNKSSTNNDSNTSWIYLIPGLLTATAILIALVGFLARKIKWKNPIKRKTKNQYDRNKTVSVQYYSRKATTMREEKVRELTEDLNKVNAERKQYEDQYKQDLAKLREMKIKRANPVEIAKLEKQIKKDQKMASSLGVTANKINEELQFTQTETYLNSLIKKLSRESTQVKNENNEN